MPHVPMATCKTILVMCITGWGMIKFIHRSD
jgi:hypothetical protein